MRHRRYKGDLPNTPSSQGAGKLEKGSKTGGLRIEVKYEDLDKNIFWANNPRMQRAGLGRLLEL